MNKTYILAGKKCEVSELNNHYILNVDEIYSVIPDDSFESVVSALEKVHKMFLTKDHLKLLKKHNPVSKTYEP